jgi:hypothetical protein
MNFLQNRNIPFDILYPNLRPAVPPMPLPREGWTVKEEESSDEVDSVSIYGDGLNHPHQRRHI